MKASGERARGLAITVAGVASRKEWGLEGRPSAAVDAREEVALRHRILPITRI
jgi:hypothetical protein